MKFQVYYEERNKMICIYFEDINAHVEIMDIGDIINIYQETKLEMDTENRIVAEAMEQVRHITDKWDNL